MVSGGRSHSGQPLLAVVLLIVCWIGMRMLIGGSAAPLSSPLPGVDPEIAKPERSTVILPYQVTGIQLKRPAISDDLRDPSPVLTRSDWKADPARVVPQYQRHISTVPQSTTSVAPASLAPSASDAISLSHAAQGGSSKSPGGHDPVTPSSEHRWSGDAWIFARDGGSRLAASSLPAPVYGGSQVGVVVRYRLAPHSAAQPVAYGRAVSALGRRRESDLAAGLSVRPVPRIPVIAAGELRLSQRAGRTELRPAAFLAAGFDEVRLPAGLRARGYAQAGYVGGRDATGFADGSLVAERPLANVDHLRLDAGAGAWAGLQRGAGRLDIGPSASLRIRLGETSARLAVDCRVRVAGNAEPARSAALTVSTGF